MARREVAVPHQRTLGGEGILLPLLTQQLWSQDVIKPTALIGHREIREMAGESGLHQTVERMLVRCRRLAPSRHPPKGPTIRG